MDNDASHSAKTEKITQGASFAEERWRWWSNQLFWNIAPEDQRGVRRLCAYDRMHSVSRRHYLHPRLLVACCSQLRWHNSNNAKLLQPHQFSPGVAWRASGEEEAGVPVVEEVEGESSWYLSTSDRDEQERRLSYVERDRWCEGEGEALSEGLEQLQLLLELGEQRFIALSIAAEVQETEEPQPRQNVTLNLA